MKLNEREVHEILAQLVTVLLTLDALERHTELSARQAALVGHARRSAEALAGLLSEQAGGRAG